MCLLLGINRKDNCMKNEILVSIICNTYNHEKYIVDALESFLMQRTSFNYEILVHDDASTDKTPEIIRRYEIKYPNIVKPLYQTENKYSKKINISTNYQYPRAKGKFYAICEGDDYWTDPYKLQKQVDYMELNQNCSLCVHAAYTVNAETKDRCGEVRPYQKSKLCTVTEVIEGGGGLFPTNSMMFKVNKKCGLPEFYVKAPVGDYPLCIYLSTIGDIYYIDEFMSEYRVNSSSSWSIRIRDKQKRYYFYKEFLDMLDSIDSYTNGLYNNSIKKLKKEYEFNLAVLENRIKIIKQYKYRDFYKKLSKKHRIKIYLEVYIPYIMKTYEKVKSPNRCNNG